MEYSYKKPNSNDSKYKLSYFRYYEKWNWIISAGIYTDDIENEIEIKRKDLQKSKKPSCSKCNIIFNVFINCYFNFNCYFTKN